MVEVHDDVVFRITARRTTNLVMRRIPKTPRNLSISHFRRVVATKIIVSVTHHRVPNISGTFRTLRLNLLHYRIHPVFIGRRPLEDKLVFQYPITRQTSSVLNGRSTSRFNDPLGNNLGHDKGSSHNHETDGSADQRHSGLTDLLRIARSHHPLDACPGEEDRRHGTAQDGDQRRRAAKHLHQCFHAKRHLVDFAGAYGELPNRRFAILPLPPREQRRSPIRIKLRADRPPRSRWIHRRCASPYQQRTQPHASIDHPVPERQPTREPTSHARAARLRPDHSHDASRTIREIHADGRRHRARGHTNRFTSPTHTSMKPARWNLNGLTFTIKLRRPQPFSPAEPCHSPHMRTIRDPYPHPW